MYNFRKPKEKNLILVKCPLDFGFVIAFSQQFLPLKEGFGPNNLGKNDGNQKSSFTKIIEREIMNHSVVISIWLILFHP